VENCGLDTFQPYSEFLIDKLIQAASGAGTSRQLSKREKRFGTRASNGAWDSSSRLRNSQATAQTGVLWVNSRVDWGASAL
jgi:hypothetical protein